MTAQATTEPSTVDPATLTKVTVYCIPKAVAALEEVAAATGGSKTDEINRALQLHAALAATRDGGQFSYEVRPGVRRHVWVTDVADDRRSVWFWLGWRGRRRG
jgi:hypothetical protein